MDDSNGLPNHGGHRSRDLISKEFSWIQIPEVEKTKSSMRQAKREGSVRTVEKGLRKKDKCNYILRLYVSGMTQRSMVAIQNIRKICDEQLKDRCDL